MTSRDHACLVQLQRMHPAWRLLRYELAPLVVGFFQRVFIAPNERSIAQSDLVAALEDELYALRERVPAPDAERPWRGVGGS